MGWVSVAVRCLGKLTQAKLGRAAAKKNRGEMTRKKEEWRQAKSDFFNSAPGSASFLNRFGFPGPMLYIIGIGLGDEKDITVRGLEKVRECDIVYLESFTSWLPADLGRLERFYGKKIAPVDRAFVENGETILSQARQKKVALLVIGDPLFATTHMSLVLEARKKGIKLEIIHNASIFSAIGQTGLQLYKFGRTTSIPLPAQSYRPETFYDVLRENRTLGLHTLFLLDIKPEENRFLKVNDAIKLLLGIEKRRKQEVFGEKTLCIGCARLGSPDQKIVSGKAGQLLGENFGKPPHCLIVPGELHFVEEEALKLFSGKARK